MTQDAAARRGARMRHVGPHDGSTSTQGASASSVGTTICYVTVRGQQVRVAVRPGSGARTPLVMCCGIGASLEVLQPLVDALPADIEVIRFDVPGVGDRPPAHCPT